jgi:flagellar basal body rod protein FlgG
MKNSIYTTAAGMMTTAEHLNTVSNNLANVSTVGFKGDIPFEQAIKFLAEGPYPGKDQPVLGGNVINLQQGVIRNTGRNLDLAVEGSGMFTVQGPDNQLLYTRNGSFNLNSDRELVSAEGYNVLDKFDKKITFFGRDFEISPSGDISIDGSYYTTLKIIESPERKDLEKVGNIYFKMKDDAPAPTVAEAPSLQVASLEQSNVNALEGIALVGQAQRTFELQRTAADVILRTLRRMITEVPRPI